VAKPLELLGVPDSVRSPQSHLPRPSPPVLPASLPCPSRSFRPISHRWNLSCATSPFTPVRICAKIRLSRRSGCRFCLFAALLRAGLRTVYVCGYSYS